MSRIAEDRCQRFMQLHKPRNVIVKFSWRSAKTWGIPSASFTFIPLVNPYINSWFDSSMTASKPGLTSLYLPLIESLWSRHIILLGIGRLY